MPDMDQHAYAVNVCHFEMAQFRPAHAGRVERHEHGAVK